PHGEPVKRLIIDDQDARAQGAISFGGWASGTGRRRINRSAAPALSIGRCGTVGLSPERSSFACFAQGRLASFSRQPAGPISPVLPRRLRGGKGRGLLQVHAC